MFVVSLSDFIQHCILLHHSFLNCVVYHFAADIFSVCVLSSLTYFLVFLAPFRTMQRLTPPSCGAKLTLHASRASGRVQCTLYRCGHGLWLALANTAARCASKPSQMVRIAEPEETALSVALYPSLSHFLSLTHTYTLTLSNTLVSLCICCCIIISR